MVAGKIEEFICFFRGILSHTSISQEMLILAGRRKQKHHQSTIPLCMHQRASLQNIMPKNDIFSFDVLLGGEPVIEYEKDGQTYVMTNLMHETTYHEERVEFVDDREERQRIPVTPYQIALTLTSLKLQQVWAEVYVDGSFIRQILLRQGQKFILKGFNDGEKIREFLFSLPRFGRDKDDHIEESRVNKVGCISVHVYEAKYKGKKMRGKFSEKSLDYIQATKKDTTIVTKGNYTMATTKPGRCIEDLAARTGGKRKRSDEVDIWYKEQEVSKLDVKYHMRHTLVDMGIQMLE
ncbi:uncharacterized protein LOC114516718 [Dendronephthya gigantea]|uniref:uncharacterized protein LOC114516718 n=1 Tax=Dendronephthya gigantea TaxID=151771 RepID=UPI001069BF69|nr:uncharacterized protein LOC114516718 [Dendronephthya gigantea]